MFDILISTVNEFEGSDKCNTDAIVNSLHNLSKNFNGSIQGIDSLVTRLGIDRVFFYVDCQICCHLVRDLRSEI